MEIQKDEKYWKDYKEFIYEVQTLTSKSPSELLTQYSELISELSEMDKTHYEEWKYEIDHDIWIRKKIQIVIEHKPIAENILLKGFSEQIEQLDLDIKKYILNSGQTDWWKNPEFKFVLK